MPAPEAWLPEALLVGSMLSTPKIISCYFVPSSRLLFRYFFVPCQSSGELDVQVSEWATIMTKEQLLYWSRSSYWYQWNDQLGLGPGGSPVIADVKCLSRTPWHFNDWHPTGSGSACRMKILQCTEQSAIRDVEDIEASDWTALWHAR